MTSCKNLVIDENGHLMSTNQKLCSNNGIVKGISLREEHHANIIEQLAFLEKHIGDSADKHAPAVEALEANHQVLKGNVGELHGK